MKSITLAIDHDKQGQFGYLTPRFTMFNGTEVNIIDMSTLQWEWDDVNCKVVANADMVIACVHIGGPLNHSRIETFLGNEELTEGALRVIPFRREPKLAQTMRLRKLAIKYDAPRSIHPRTWGNPNRPSRLQLANDADWCVLKSQSSATGYGQVKFNSHRVTVSEIMRLLAKYKEDTSMLNTVLTEMGATLKLNPEAPEKSLSLMLRSVYVQEFIPDIVEEYRILAAQERYHLVNRAITPGDYPQAAAGMDIDRVPTEIFKESGILPDYIFKIIDELLKTCPIMSIDVYKTSNGQYGIFEYSNEFSLQYICPEWRRKWLEESVGILIAQHCF